MFDPDSLPPLREVIARYDLRAEKKLGQNFLLDTNITDKIARQCGDLTGRTVFEIGPGPGGLTRSLLKAGAGKVIAIEFDARAVEALSGLKEAAGARLEILQADALQTDLCALSPEGQAHIVANLPYNIATPLLVGWLRQIRRNPDCFAGMTLMFQKEVAQRITALPATKAYGRLSVLSQWLCDVRKMYDLPPSAFTPPPKVSSSIVRFTPKQAACDAPAFATLEKLTAAAFGQRRKMLRSSLKDYGVYLDRLGVDPSLRAEVLPPEKYIELAKAIDSFPSGS